MIKATNSPVRGLAYSVNMRSAMPRIENMRETIQAHLLLLQSPYANMKQIKAKLTDPRSLAMPNLGGGRFPGINKGRSESTPSTRSKATRSLIANGRAEVDNRV